MNTDDRPTPETDAYIKAAWGNGFAAKLLEDPMRRLERQLGEARDRIAQLETQLAELRKPKKPETFKSNGLAWIKHLPGNPMPCAPDAFIRALWRCEKHGKYTSGKSRAKYWDWSDALSADEHIIGWNYADAP